MKAKIGEHLRRGTARADTAVAILTLLAAGWTAARSSWLLAVPLLVIGLVFVVSSGSYCWRKGYAARNRQD